MKKIDANDPDSRSADVVAGNIEQLKTLFPDAVSEGKVDFAVLKQLLGGAVDDGDEKYGLNWHGKKRARQLALTPSTGTLRPCQEESVDWATTQNLIIEGDNLEVLKLLQKSYAGKVKLIYIDPPYNTGKDFVYKDDYQDNVKNYLMLTGQIDSDGRKISSNMESSGRFHTDWLNMMYPRLVVARDLLQDDGAIMISIDDNEASNLKRVCDEIFGVENHLITLYVQVRYADKTLAEKNDYQKLIEQVLVYGKGQFAPTKESEDYGIDSFCWRITSSAVGKTLEVGGRTVTVFADDEWSIEQVPPSLDALKETWASGSVLKTNASGKYFGDHLAPRKDADGLGCLYKVEGIGEDGLGYRYFTGPRKSDATRGKFYSGVPTERRSQLASGTAKKYKPVSNFYDFSDAFGNCRLEGGVAFGSGKKPVAFLKRLLGLAADPGGTSIVLDFFAGSGSTAQATLELCQEDGLKRRYILVQFPEESSEPGYSNIADMTRRRLQNVSATLREAHPVLSADVGFRAFKLASSNISEWDARRNDLPSSLEAAVDHVKTDRTEADILFELLLKLGLDLCVPIEKRAIAGKDVHAIGGGVLMACLAPAITRDDAEALALGVVEWHKALAPAGETTCVFRDNAFVDDVAKANVAAILEQHGLTNTKSL